MDIEKTSKIRVFKSRACDGRRLVRPGAVTTGSLDRVKQPSRGGDRVKHAAKFSCCQAQSQVGPIAAVDSCLTVCLLQSSSWFSSFLDSGGFGYVAVMLSLYAKLLVLHPFHSRLANTTRPAPARFPRNVPFVSCCKWMYMNASLGLQNLPDRENLQ